VEAEASAAALSVGATRTGRNLRRGSGDLDEDSTIRHGDTPTGWINVTSTCSVVGDVWR